MTRKGNPLFTIPGVVLETGSFVISGIISFFIKDDNNNNNDNDNNETRPTFIPLVEKIHSTLEETLNFLSLIPEIVKIIYTNIINFFYIFCILIVIGRFDWFLDDPYAISAISVGITYIVNKT